LSDELKKHPGNGDASVCRPGRNLLESRGSDGRRLAVMTVEQQPFIQRRGKGCQVKVERGFAFGLTSFNTQSVPVIFCLFLGFS
jgi:hypothetical protein